MPRYMLHSSDTFWHFRDSKLGCSQIHSLSWATEMWSALILPVKLAETYIYYVYSVCLRLCLMCDYMLLA